MGKTRDHLIAGLWGAAEATCFFIVPDVWLSRIATKSPRRAMWASVTALVGAVAGGIATYQWGSRTHPEASKAALRRLPAISAAMIERCETDLSEKGTGAMLSGPLRGVPYKIYARTAGMQRRSLPEFIAWSVPARIPRFLLVSALATGLTRGSERVLGVARTARLSGPVHTVFWIAFYAWYLRTVGREPRADGRADAQGSASAAR